MISRTHGNRVAFRICSASLALLAALSPSGARADERAPVDGVALFEKQVQPILQARCISCHGGKKTRSGLNLTSRQGLLKGGDRGPAVELDSPEASLLLEAINYEDLEMPPTGKLPQEQIDVLTRWVKMGAPWPETAAAALNPGPPRVDDRARSFWSFRPVVRPELPEVKRADWIKTPIDAFIMAKLESTGLEPAPAASRTSLLRRVYYDLIGLPPSTQEVEEFLADTSPEAYEKVVDRLLASPHYGERWARHWLDLVRYAETNGYEFDSPKPSIWRYRDYVIKSFNEDKPYDQFVKEQLAGDEQEPETSDGLIATGYYRLGAWDGGAPDRVQAVYDDLDDIVATTGQVFLGLTINCARCHDHKIDPFPTRDYYRLLAFFRGIKRYNQREPLRTIVLADEAQKAEAAANQKELAALAEQMRAVEDALLPHLEAGERDDFQDAHNRLDIVRKHTPKHVNQEDSDRYRSLSRKRAMLERSRPQALCVAEAGRTPPDTFILHRGSPRSPGEKVEPGFPSVLSTETPAFTEPAPDAKTAGRRRVLADWIAQPDNPLTARVMANRIWQFHFGRGIVRSSSDFGYRGTPPTHPELLDWLASELVAGGWKMKAMHKLVMMSNAYQMSSQPHAQALAKDPENDLFWRFDVRRLSAEEIRDSILAVSGNLNLKMGGPSIYPNIQQVVLYTQSMPGVGWEKSPPEERTRRSIYVHIKRSLLVPFLAVFDAPDPDSSCPARFTSTQPTQALGMLNGDFLQEQAQVFADNVRESAADDREAQVRLILRRVTQREPSRQEVARGVELMQRLEREHELSRNDALRGFCLLALNLNEFIYLD